MYKVLITTVPFGEVNPCVLDLLNKEEKIQYDINPLGRRLKENELYEMIDNYDILIAGTEPITDKIISKSNLRMISRVGIGLDSVDLKSAFENDVKVTFTPDAPSKAVAELTVAQMINLSRQIVLKDKEIRRGVWQRHMGSLISECNIGIVGTGRIGKLVLGMLKPFGPKEIFVNDVYPDYKYYEEIGAKFVEKTMMYKECDIISFHIPLTSETKNLICKPELRLFKENAKIINTSRGGIINEDDLFDLLAFGRADISAAIDVFEDEPYNGRLIQLNNVNLTCHMGSCTVKSREDMEFGAVEEVLRFVNKQELRNLVSKGSHW